MDRFAVFAFRWMAARSCSLMRMFSFLFFISYSVSKSGCRASARRAAAAGVGFAGDQPSAMLALSPKGEYKSVTLRYSAVYHGRKKVAYTPFAAPYFTFVRLGRVFARFSACSAYRAFFAAVSAEARVCCLISFSAVIYTQWV